MAKRYSGDLQINVVYDDKGHYRTSVSRGGKLLWRGGVNPAPAGFGPGVAYDSPKAYDEIARSALTFADDEIGGIGDDAEVDENLTGYLIRRSPPAKATRHHATRRRKTAAQLDREINDHLRYRVVWIRDDKKQRGVLFPGPLTHKEALTVVPVAPPADRSVLRGLP